MFLSEQKKKGATSGWSANKHFPHFSAQGCEGQKSSVMYNSPTASSAFSFFCFTHAPQPPTSRDKHRGGKWWEHRFDSRVLIFPTRAFYSLQMFFLSSKSHQYIIRSLLAFIQPAITGVCAKSNLRIVWSLFFLLLLITICLKVRNWKMMQFFFCLHT